MTNFMEYQQKRLNSLMLGSHESKKYCCMQKISSLAQKMAILGPILFSDKILILVWGFQPLCSAKYEVIRISIPGFTNMKRWSK